MNEQIQEVEQEIIAPRQHPGMRLGQQPQQANMIVEQNTVALLNKSEIDQQIATAHAYPRSITHFRDEAMAMVCLNESIAQACIYALPRDGKVIEGPSVRFAEIVQSAWGNCRAGARVVNEGAEFVTAQGVFHDLEKNAAITYEVQRRITKSNGQRFKTDMIGVTGNAACSIALRNAILKGIPMAFWADIYDVARRTVMGDFKTLANRRAAAIESFKAYGIKDTEIFALLGVAGIEDIAPEHIVTLRGVLTALKEGDTTVEEAFNRKPPTAPSAPPAPTPSAPAAPAATATPRAAKKPGKRTSTPYKDMAAKPHAETVDPETGEVFERSDAPFSNDETDAHLADLNQRFAAAPTLEDVEAIWAEHTEFSEKRMFPPDRSKAIAQHDAAKARFAKE